MDESFDHMLPKVDDKFINIECREQRNIGTIKNQTFCV